MKFDIVALGEPLFELSQQPDGRFLPGFGGDTSNVAIAAARLGARSAYITRVGNDAPGEALLELWQQEGIDSSGVGISADAPTGLYLVTHGPSGHTFSYYRKGSAASLMSPGDVPADVVGGAKFLHVSAISQAISETARATVNRAMAIAKAAGVAVSYDTNLRLKLWSLEKASPVILEAARIADIIKTSLDDAIQLTGLADPQAIADLLRGGGKGIVIITLGANGVFVAAASESFQIQAHQVAAVDATGAGDAFTGALLTELSRECQLGDAVRFANAAAALSTLGYGAVAPLPDRRAVEVFLAGQLG